MAAHKNAQKTFIWQVVIYSYIFQIISGLIQYSILEEMKKGSLVGNVANDLNLDDKELETRKLKIVTHTKKQYFNISLENGNLYVHEKIDRDYICGMEVICLLNLEILAENPVNVFHVKIEVKDINDNAPSFSKSIFDLAISESAAPGTHYALDKARDPDIGLNSIQSYNLTPNQFFKLGEKISTEGIKYPELVLEKALDREQMKFYELILTASDGGKPMKTGTALITITIQDVNDNFPVFSQDTYRISVEENLPNNSLVLHLSATDKDEGPNAEISYSFSHIAESAKDTFKIDSHVGDIITSGPLDFEVTQNYEITVEAKDGGGLTTHCTVFIQIVDVNDNSPEILVASLITPIREDFAPGMLIALIHIIDLDSEKNGEVTCQIAETSLFKLLPTSSGYYKLLTSSVIDRESNSIYNITIIAKDEGFPAMETRKNIQLNVLDVNDNPPIFNNKNYIAFVIERNLPGTAIHNVHASDLDTGENARVVYSILNTIIENIPVSSYVSINSGTGVIYAQQSFDYEQLREFQIQVMARDSGSPSLNSNVTVRICIVDKNDNAPVILYPSPDIEGKPLFEFIPSSSEKGYLVTKVIAVDADSGHNAWLSYHLLEGPGSSFFTIGQHTGEIKLAKDFQDTDFLRQTVVVMVKDNGIPALSATVTLNMVMGDNFQQVLPELVKQPTTSDVSSNVTFYLVISITFISLLFIMTVIVTVITKCRKSTTPTSFSTSSRPWYPQFSLKYPSQLSDGSLPFPYSYDVCVTLDSSQNEVAYLKPVQDIPTDNLINTDDLGGGIESTKEILPSCSVTQDIYRISLKEDAPNGFLVLHVDATDEDEGSNAEITYSFSHIATNKMDIFNLDPENGEIKLSGPLDYEVKQNYEMTVEAKDGGGLVTYCTVLIQVVDVNDNAPEIQLVSLTNPISEDSVSGTMVAEFQVKDLDSERNGEVSCEITEALLFKLMPTSTNYYRLVTLSSLDRETLSMYNITIIAKDEGSPQLFTKKAIQIAISDVNDNPPFFEKLNYIVYVSENNQPGTSIYRIQASDLDSDKNARIAYSILNKNISDIPISSYISMNSKTGVIRAQRSFDYEQLRDFNFQVIAKDSGSPSLSSNVTVRLCVIDKNDNAPKILYPSQDMDGTLMFEYIPHSAKNGYLVTKVIAVDLDSGHNGWLSYHLLQVPDPSFLNIGQHTGEIRLARDFKDSDSLRQKIVVLVKDNGLPSLSATVTLNFVMAEDFQQAFPEIVKQPKESDVSSNGTFYLVIAITFISILFIVTVAVTVIAKCRRKHNPNSLGALSRTWYPQLSLNYPTQFSDGSLPLPYSYDVCVTLDSKQNEIAYLKPVQNVPTDNLIDTDDSLVVNETEVGSTQVSRIYYLCLKKILLLCLYDNFFPDP
uniref:Cadherin domain-containing protein n=1 Tax=Leptobrachium leishanense TaxID=445787 RepID=A0A8C5PHQ0_9ANUR